MNTIFRSIVASFRHASRGLLLAYRTERSFRIQLVVGLIVMVATILLPLKQWERVVLLLAIAGVLVLELLNSSLERLVDLLKPRLHEYVADIKDLMAGAVLLSAVFAALLGILILWPYVGTVLARV
ncbi:MAG: diacylglycerol kinase family protein [Patescibacteria group bacterium]